MSLQRKETRKPGRKTLEAGTPESLRTMPPCLFLVWKGKRKGREGGNGWKGKWKTGEWEERKKGRKEKERNGRKNINSPEKVQGHQVYRLLPSVKRIKATSFNSWILVGYLGYYARIHRQSSSSGGRKSLTGIQARWTRPLYIVVLS